MTSSCQEFGNTLDITVPVTSAILPNLCCISFMRNNISIFCMPQGIWLCEHRDAPTPRKVVVTLNGI